MPKLSYLKALNRALADEMERDENIILLGEDIKLGLTNATTGLYARFGDGRVLETPLSEQGFTNFATGAALVALILRPSLCGLALRRGSALRRCGGRASSRSPPPPPRW